MDYIQHLFELNKNFPRIVAYHLIPRIRNKIPPQVSNEELSQIYPNESSNLSQMFQDDMDKIFSLIEPIKDDLSDEDLQEIPNIINYILKEEYLILERHNREDRQSQTGGKFTYKGRKYVIRQGDRSGKYILVKGKKVYLSQI